MSVIGDIENTIHLLRKQPGLAAKRLSYEVSEAEWRELVRDLEKSQPWLGHDLSYADSLIYKGLRIRKRASADAGVTPAPDAPA